MRLAAQGVREVIPFDPVVGNIVIVRPRKGQNMPQMSDIDFAWGAEVQPLPIASCSSSSPGCQMLYDGVKTPWQGQFKEESVSFTFGDHPETVSWPRKLNELHIRYTAHDNSAKKIRIVLKCDSRQEQTLDLVFSNGLNDVTLALQEQITRRANMTYHTLDGNKPGEFNEVMFWYSAEALKQTRDTTQVSTKKTNEALQQRVMMQSRGEGFWDALANGAKFIAMHVCLGALQVGQWALGFAKFVVNGIASVAIAILEGLIKLLGPKFFKIMDFMVEGGLGDLAKGGVVMFGFNIHMYLFGAEIGPWGFEVEFSLMAIISKLMGKVKEGISKLF